jgi:hypothetical protein
LAGLKKWQKQDFRIEILKRFLILDENVLSEEVMEMFYSLVRMDGIPVNDAFSQKIQNVFVDLRYLEKL